MPLGGVAVTVKKTLCLLLLVAGGCGGPLAVGYPPDAPGRVAAVDRILPGIPSQATTSAGSMRPDGIQVSVWFFGPDRDESSPAVMVKGRVEILMFDGVVPSADLATAMPLRVWEFPGDQLGQYAGKHYLMGWGYNFGLLRWGDARPTQDRVTMIVRYTGQAGPAMSAPTIVTVGATNDIRWEGR